MKDGDNTNKSDEHSDLAGFSDFTPYHLETDRKRGILTEGDREYLKDPTTLTGQDERNTRYRIRQRVFQSLVDIRLLERLSDRDLERVLNHDGVMPDLLLVSLLRLSYRIARLTSDNTNEDFEGALEGAIIQEVINSMLTKDPIRATTADVTAEISVQEKPFDAQETVEDLLEEGDAEGLADLDAHLRRRLPVLKGINVHDSEPVTPEGLNEELEVHPVLKEMIEAAMSESDEG